MTTENEMMIRTLCKDGCRLDESTFARAAGVVGHTLIEGITSSAAELNILTGATLDVDELNVLDGIAATLTAAELSILDGVTSTAAELNLTDGFVADAADGLGFAKVAVATYDFAEHTGVQGAYDLGVTLPDNAVIYGGFVDKITTCTSANDSGTMAIHANAANDIVTATAISSGTTWDAPGRLALTEVMTAATTLKLTAARAITATIAVQDFTAGKFVVVLYYVVTV